MESNTPVAASFAGAKAAFAGGASTCGVTPGDTLECWGYNFHNELGRCSDEHHTPLPDEVQGLATLSGGSSSVAMAESHRCALLDDTTVKCWGSNQFGEAGDYATGCQAGPVHIANDLRVEAIAVDTRVSCALLEDQSIWCWGWSRSGYLNW